jgi:hypothetical protein
MTPTELWLPIGAAAFYLYDSCCLLWQNELVYTRGKRWRVHGGTELRITGRRVFVPPPLLPLRPQFVVRWSVDDTRSAAGDAPSALIQALRPVGVINQLQLVLLLALPLVSWTQGAGIVMLVVFAFFYLLTITALALLWRRRARCGLKAKAFWLLVLDALACAPFAVNLTRKVSMQHGLAGDPLRFAARQLDPATRETVRKIIAARLEEEHADASERAREALNILQSRLENPKCAS